MNEPTTTNPLEFRPFDKIPRLSRDIVITEKLDGTNAQILIVPIAELPPGFVDSPGQPPYMTEGEFVLLAGSRNRWLAPANDNYGFGAWVHDNRRELVKLGPGRHFGEWWGAGIQRRYGIQEKRFSLFNVGRWEPCNFPNMVPGVRDQKTFVGTTCCRVVPVLYRGPFDEAQINTALGRLEMNGSTAAPGFMDPEGIVIFHEAAGKMFKKTIKDDEKPKGAYINPISPGGHVSAVACILNHANGHPFPKGASDEIRRWPAPDIHGER